MTSDSDKLVSVYAGIDAGFAHVLRNMLQDNGITARVTGDMLAHASLANIANVEVIVFESQEAQARQLIEDALDVQG